MHHSTNINPKNFKNSTFFNPENDTVLDEEEKKSCREGVVNEEECTYKCAQGKTPGVLPYMGYVGMCCGIRYGF